MAIIDIKLPKYTTTLPVSKTKVEYRPFTVREEKILLLAQEDGKQEAVIESISQIISNCTFGKHTVDSLNKVDAEYLFIQLRNKSMGEGVDIKAVCDACGEKTSMTLNLDRIAVKNADKKNEPIKLMMDVWVSLKYPTIKEAMSLTEKDGTIAIAMSLDQIIQGENVKSASDYTMEERIEFVESLTNIQLAEFKKFFDDFPVLELDLDFKCKCGEHNHIHVEGIENFFG